LPKPLFPSDVFELISEHIGSDEPEEEDVRDVDVQETYDFSGYTILLAEDVEINREIVLSLLEPSHLTIECAVNGAQAVEMFRKSESKYGMIFMDIQMPEMDGYEATQKIRASWAPDAETIPIIAMTANVFREDIEKCLEVGMNGHIGKPVNLDEIHKQLREHLLKD